MVRWIAAILLLASVTSAVAFDPIDGLPVKDFGRLPTVDQFKYAQDVATKHGIKARSNVVACLSMMGDDPRYEHRTVMDMVQPCVDGIKAHWE